MLLLANKQTAAQQNSYRMRSVIRNTTIIIITFVVNIILSCVMRVTSHCLLAIPLSQIINTLQRNVGLLYIDRWCTNVSAVIVLTAN